MNPAQPDRPLRLGTRGSTLALRQADIVLDALRRAVPDLAIETEIIHTQGDAETEPLTPTEGSFVRTIETALLQGRIDLAVHSSKDMPSIDTPGLAVAGMPVREDPRDVLVSCAGMRLADLASNARVGTGSPRRHAAVRALRPDLRVEPIRGNVDTRLRRVAEGDYDAIILAAAGLKRLGRTADVAEFLDPATFVPAVGQGILAIQVRADDAPTAALVDRLDDPDTRACARAERAVAITIQASCNTPLGAYARISDGNLHLHASLLSKDGATLVHAEAAGSPDEAERIGIQVGNQLLAEAKAGR